MITSISMRKMINANKPEICRSLHGGGALCAGFFGRASNTNIILFFIDKRCILEEVMMYEPLYFYLSAYHIVNHLRRVFAAWGYFAITDRSTKSDSRYILLFAGTKENPKNLRIRVSDHPPCEGSRYDYDISASFRRDNCLTYVKLIVLLAKELEKPIPPIYEKLLRREIYKQYSIALQQKRVNLSWRNTPAARFYVK